MTKQLFFRTHPLLASVIVVAALYIVVFAAYGTTRWASAGEVLGRVEISGTPVGGLDRDQLLGALVAVEEEHVTRPATFTIESKPVTLNPAEAGFDIAEERVADAVMRIGREGNAANQFLWWLQHLFSTATVPLTGSTDPQAMAEIFDTWDREVISMPATLGGVILESGVPQPVYPEAGVGIDRESAVEIIETSLLADTPNNEALPTETIIPQLTSADIDRAVVEAGRLLSGPIEMFYNDEASVFSVAQLREAFRSETIAGSEPRVVNSFDPAVIDGFLEPIRSDFEAEPINAELVVISDIVTIKDGVRGTRIDEEETAARLYQAGLTSARHGQLPLVEDADPEITTEYLESLDIKHLVSSFTTYHQCCQDRVNNIQNMADTIDGHILLPGEIFSINDFVGERTLEKGYLPAGTLIAGRLVDTVGGGVSQFATTFYNAVFWGGYEDVEHQPHSYWFSRYPEGIEATVNWRTPDLKFRNNRDHAVLIDTEHTDTSITVRFFGNNDGRIVKGEQKNGETNITVVAEGGPNALHVEAIVSDRYAFTSPPSPQYAPNPALEVDHVDELQSEAGGWSVTVTRRILRGGTELVEEQEWVVRYAPRFAVYEVHPCKVPGTAVPCPTTTTMAPTTTSTVTTTTEG